MTTAIKVLTSEKVEQQLLELRRSIRRESIPIPAFRFIEKDVDRAQDPGFDDSAWREFRVGDYWGGYDVTAWFRTRVEIPARLRREKLALRFLTGPRDGGDSTAEALLFVDGRPLQAIDIWHEEAWLPPELLGAGEISIALKVWSGVLGVPERRRFKVAELVRIDPAAEALWHLADNVRKAIAQLDNRDWRFVKMIGGLDEALALIDWSGPGSDGYYASVRAALDLLRSRVREWERIEPEKPTVVGVGHAHIDMAWLWRLSHSREKAARTFSTALHLMRQYPEYRFMHSSPQLYSYLEQDYPEIFEAVRERIAAGDWEITGAMWIESDVNLPSGESLIRQILHGKRYISEKFGRDSTVVWLPDVFGYSGALPQILVKSGIRYFMTTKISWSQFNRFPHDTFKWRGLDGSEILAHFITTPEEGSKAFTYNGLLEPKDVRGLWENYQQKAVNDELLQAYGWGDGGGGPTKEMIEAARAMCNLPGLPKVQLGLVEPFFRRLEERLEGKPLPVWDGELYLEYHRGTYTSQARTKRNNRKSEVLFHQAEVLASMAALLTGDLGAYPDLTEAWQLLLLNQFHDILPGSSIREVYEDSERDFERIRELGGAALEGSLAGLARAVEGWTPGLLAVNTGPFARAGLVEINGALGAVPADERGQPLPWQRVGDDDSRLLVLLPELPALGFRRFDLLPLLPATGEGHADTGPAAGQEVREPGAPRLPATPFEGGAMRGAIRVGEREIETPFYRIVLNARGQIVSLLDRRENREVLGGGRRGNVLQAFEDKPLKFDAWDIDLFYQEKMREVDALDSVRVLEEGPLRGVLELRWRFQASTISQRLTVYAHDPRIDFVTEVDWRESQTLLKVAFPTGVRSPRATFDIQFGSIERPTHWNTSWDWARFEVVGHKWADLSEGNYGVALLNDCKYGFDVKDDVMRLTLIKSSIRPDPLADKGLHEFTYSLLPHAGTWREGGVIPQGYALNVPLLARVVEPGGGAPWAGDAPFAGDATGGGGTVGSEDVGPEAVGPEAVGPEAVGPGAVDSEAVGSRAGGAFAFATSDRDNVIVETVKRAEDGDGWIVRIYESKQFRNARARLRFGLPPARAIECNLVEEGESPVTLEGSDLVFAIDPFEIKTFRVWFG